MADFKKLNGYTVKDEFARNRFTYVDVNVPADSATFNQGSADLPTGYTYNNCVIIGVMHKDFNDYTTFDYGYLNNVGGYPDRILVRLGSIDGTTIDNKLHVTMDMSSGYGSSQTVVVRVILMKL